MSFEFALDAWQRGERQSAIAIWQTLAEGGDPRSQYNLLNIIWVFYSIKVLMLSVIPSWLPIIIGRLRSVVMPMQH